MLRIEDLHVFYGDIQALWGVSFEVHDREIVTLVGSNGAGKTTTLRTISGVLRAARGAGTPDGTAGHRGAGPKVLRLRDPSLGLAPRLVAELFRIVGEINSQGVTVLLVEQNVHQALEIAHRAYVLETGRIVKEGAARDLLNDPAIKEAYLGL